ncbi:uncharacterized protein LOC125472775 [Pyrus x bretschneideri]|uniref:uncharacterized protein LOC125472775 n=1 Tax=Pyrus x bretschneideri TaxID=225117 RepID=UPI00202E6EF7|nr:uncharacterized protein LOC125472775 [Pyrus x bretschneideri]
MTNMSRSPFTDEIEQAKPPSKFSMPHFTFFKRDGDPERHLKHYRSTMVLYWNNNALMCKIFATNLQGEAQDWFHTLLPRSIWSFDDISLVFTKEYSFHHSIKKKSDHLFNMKKNLKKSLYHYVKWFKAEKAKIVKCNDSIASATFQKGFPRSMHLLEAEFIEEVAHSAWLANVMPVVKKEKGKWRVCADYTDLNKAYPEDPYSLPRINLPVDSTSRNQLLSFLDTYFSYNQIAMYEPDKEKTAFVIE